MSDMSLLVEGVSKEYRLGAIGGGTLRGDLQSLMARIRGKEDPNLKIGSVQSNEKFMALQDISFQVKQGEAIGIIGHNGAGKSTLLKLLSRVTAPTTGTICLNGRIASMLEVGTGFHPELTGRENVYMNGAILGMTKAEITRKFDEIVEFAEMSKFIDTPVKRYSSGMYVKLAFAVAAHLDSEILVMDEVLAVGDMKFQQKCLGKMSEISAKEGRTILYVSHNMGTVRQLCNRSLVLNHGTLQFDGDVEEAISLYFNTAQELQTYHESEYKEKGIGDDKCRILSTQVLNSPLSTFHTDDKMEFELTVGSNIEEDNMLVHVIVTTGNEMVIGSSFAAQPVSLKKGENKYTCSLDLSHIPPGQFAANVVLCQQSEYGSSLTFDKFSQCLSFKVEPAPGYCNNNPWWHRHWGYCRYDDFDISVR